MDIYELDINSLYSKVTGSQPDSCEWGVSVKEEKSQEPGQIDRGSS